LIAVFISTAVGRINNASPTLGVRGNFIGDAFDGDPLKGKKFSLQSKSIAYW
jgi:hypothetical protein